MEHLRHFGLHRDPFANDPLVPMWFASGEHESAERRLLRAVGQGKGLCVLTGAEGTGKTMIVRHLLEGLEEELYEACLLVPMIGVSDGYWVLTRFARQLGVEDPADDRSELLGQIYEQLAIVREESRSTVLIIDEAQVLVEKGALGELRGLLNLEYETRRLVTIVLVGLSSLEHAIAADPALASRVDVNCRVRAMDTQAAVEYLKHRIRCVEGDPAILGADTVATLIELAGGVPRRLNTLADNALFEAYVAGRTAATPEDVRRAAADLRLECAPAEMPAPPPAFVAPAPVAPHAPVAHAPVAPTHAPAAAHAPEPVDVFGDAYDLVAAHEVAPEASFPSHDSEIRTPEPTRAPRAAAAAPAAPPAPARTAANAPPAPTPARVASSGAPPAAGPAPRGPRIELPPNHDPRDSLALAVDDLDNSAAAYGARLPQNHSPRDSLSFALDTFERPAGVEPARRPSAARPAPRHSEPPVPPAPSAPTAPARAATRTSMAAAGFAGFDGESTAVLERPFVEAPTAPPVRPPAAAPAPRTNAAPPLAQGGARPAFAPAARPAPPAPPPRPAATTPAVTDLVGLGDFEDVVAAASIPSAGDPPTAPVARFVPQPPPKDDVIDIDDIFVDAFEDD